MWVYASPLTMTGASALSLMLLLWLGTGRNPYELLRSALQVRNARFLGLVAGMFLLLYINKLQTSLEPVLEERIPWDFTGPITALGANWLLALQQLEHPAATHFLTYIYVILFPMLPLASMAIYAAARDHVAIRRLFTSFLAAYLIGLPFFLFFPVKEAWAADLGIRFLIPDVYPAFEQQFRQFSALDNCFPSMHTGLSVLAALVAWRQGYRRWGMLLSVIAGLVMLSTLYLGVHSILDMVAGTLLAMVVSGNATAMVVRRIGVPVQK